MQAFIGVIVFAIVVMIAIAISLDKTKSKKGFSRFVVYIPPYFVGTVVACYVAMAIIGAIIWIISWIGILLREILQWLIVAVLYPWQWIF